MFIGLLNYGKFINNLTISTQSSESLSFTADNPKAHAYLLMNGGGWSLLDETAGWPLQYKGYYNLSLSVILCEGVKVNLLCLFYDKDRKQVHKRFLGTLPEGEGENLFSFAAMGDSCFFNLVLYLPIQENERSLILKEAKLSFCGY